MNEVTHGKLVVIAAPSGAGKTSLVKALVEQTDDIDVAVSHTTRQMRPGETDGLNYHFVSRPQFEDLIGIDGFIEYAEVFGNLYGTSRSAMNKIIELGKNLVLEIDYQGAAQIRDKVPEAVTIFILPPSLATLKNRLTNRGQDDEQTIARRTSEAFNEISHYHEFDYLIVNDSFDLALNQINAVINGEGAEFSLEQQRKALADLLSELLSSHT